MWNYLELESAIANHLGFSVSSASCTI